MNVERELLERWLIDFGKIHPDVGLIKDTKELLAQPEQEPVADKPTETAMAVMPSGVFVSNVYDAYEEGRKSVMVKQEQESIAKYRECYKKGFLDGAEPEQELIDLDKVDKHLEICDKSEDDYINEESGYNRSDWWE